MAGKICAVFGCKNYNVTNCSKSFFRFPADPTQCKRWLWNSRRADLDIVVEENGLASLHNRRICSDHFKLEDFRNPKMPSQGLVRGAIPTLMLPGSRGNTTKRKSPKKRKIFSPSPETQCSSTDESFPSDGVLPDARIPKRSRISIELQMKTMQQKLRQAQKTISRQRKLINMLRKEKQLQKQEPSLKLSELKECFGNDSVLMSFLQNQKKKPKGRRYTQYDKTFAYAIYYCSPKAYKFLQKFFCLPTIRSLRLWLQDLSVAPGINDNIMKLLKLKASQLPIQDRVVCLVIDEMSLKENVTYNSPADIFEGYPDLGEELKCFEPSSDQPLKFANQATVLMIRGIKKNFKQIIGYLLTAGSMIAETLKEALQVVIRRIQDTGFIIKAIVCDQGSNNVKMHRLLDVTCDKPFIVINGERIYTFFDAPHLLKSIRNNFKKYDVLYNGKIASFQHVVQFYEKDKTMNPRMAPKISKKHIELPPFSPMRVCLAAQLLSHSVSCGILTHVALNNMPSKSAFTAEFIHDFDSLFDVFNSSKKLDAKIYRRAISNDCLHWKFLDEMERKLKAIKFINSKRSVAPCVKGWLLNISALKHLWKELNVKFNFKYLITRRLTQDCLENVFSVIRSKGFHNVTPDCSKFRAAIRGVISNQMLMPSQDSNCELDFSQCLLLKSDFKKCCAGIVLTKEDNVQSSDADLDVVQANSVQYVAGWACSTLNHDVCKKHLSSLNESFAATEIHISMKKYENVNYLFPNHHAENLSVSIYSSFTNKFQQLLLQSRTGVKEKLMNDLKVPTDCPVCPSCVKLFADKIFNVHIKCFLKTTNDGASQRLANKENKKAKKFCTGDGVKIKMFVELMAKYIVMCSYQQAQYFRTTRIFYQL